MNNYPNGIQLSPGDIVRHNSILKEVSLGNCFVNNKNIWGSIRFMDDDSFYYTHKGGIELVDFD